MSYDALLASCKQLRWLQHKVVTVCFFQHASVLLHYSFDFNPLTHNEVYCDMIAQQYIWENCMNADHSGHTQIQMLPLPPSGTRTHSIQMMHCTLKICVMKKGGSSTEIYLWRTWMTESFSHTDSLVHPSGRAWASGNLLHSLLTDLQ